MVVDPNSSDFQNPIDILDVAFHIRLDDLRHALQKNQVDLDDGLPNLRKVTFEPDGAITIVRRLPKERGFEKPSRKRK
jgi:hypothetical protein